MNRLLGTFIPEFILLYYRRKPKHITVYNNPASVNIDGTSILKDYVVQSGDTITDIAHYHGLTPQGVLLANPQIKNPHLIYPGDVVHFTYTLTY